MPYTSSIPNLMRHSTSKGYNNQTNRAIEKFDTDLKSSYCSNYKGLSIRLMDC